MNLADVVTGDYGPNITEYLEPIDWYTLSQVSRSFHHTTKRFREVVRFVTDNDVYYDKMPLRFISRVSSYSMKELYEAYEFLWTIGKKSTMLMMSIRAEAEANDLVIQNIQDIIQLKNYAPDLYTTSHLNKDNSLKFMKDEAIKAGYDTSLIKEITSYDPNSVYVMLASISADRFNPYLFRYALQHYEGEYDWTQLNMLNYDIRAVIIEYRTPGVIRRMMQNLDFIYGKIPDNLDAFALVFNHEHLIMKAIENEDYVLYIVYLGQYVKKPDEAYIKSIFRNKPKVDDFLADTIIKRSGGFL